MSCVLPNGGESAISKEALFVSFAVGSLLINRNFVSKCLANLDNLVLWAKKGNLMFRDGYGDLSGMEAADSALIQATVAGIDVFGAHKVTLDDEGIVVGKVKTLQGSFASPVARYFSPHDFPIDKQSAIHQACFEMVLPLNTTWQQAQERGLPVVILLPFTGDEGYHFRRMMLSNPLAAQHNFVCLLLESPFYGKRRLPGVDKSSFPLPLLEHVGEQVLGLVMESITLVKWLKESVKYAGPIGLCGISLGGSMASYASVLCPYDHAVISLVPSASRRAYIDGGMSSAIDFTRFGPIECCGNVLHGKEAAQVLLERISITHLVRNGPTNVARVILQLTAEDDIYIPTDEFALPLFETLRTLPSVKFSELTVLPGGHISAIMFYPTAYVSKIVEGMQRMVQILEDN